MNKEFCTGNYQIKIYKDINEPIKYFNLRCSFIKNYKPKSKIELVGAINLSYLFRNSIRYNCQYSSNFMNKIKKNN